MYIGFTGTRSGMTNEQKAMLRCIFEDCFVSSKARDVKLEFVHGGAVGADREAHHIARNLSFEAIHIYPCHRIVGFDIVWNYPPVKAVHVLHTIQKPLVRNRMMVDLANGMIAAPLGYEEELRSGTWATIRYARKTKTPLKIIWPNGSVTVENSSAKAVPVSDFTPTSNITGNF